MSKLPQLDLVTRNKLYESNTANQRRQQIALHRTLSEIAFIEDLEGRTPGAYTSALGKLRVKSDRQENNLRTTEAYLAALKAANT